MPLSVVGAFLVLIAVVVPVELLVPMGPLQRVIGQYISQSAVSSLLPAIATSLVTASSITFSLLLMAVQQAASRYSQVVFDQFLRRRINQFAIGFFTGLASYCLTLIFFVSSTKAVLSASLALLLAVVALVLLVVLVYVAIDQMRPSSVVWSIQTMTLRARRRQMPLLARCRPEAHLADADVGTTPVRAGQVGFVVDIDADKLAAGLTAVTGEVEYSAVSGEVEIELHARLGTHLVVGETVAEVRGGTEREREHLAGTVLNAITLGRMRDSDSDPGYGVDQLGNMAWTLGSTGTQDPEGALVAIRGLHTLLVEWGTTGRPSPGPYGGPLPVVYRDGSVQKVVDSLVSELIVSTESSQYHVCAEVLDTFGLVLPRLGEDVRAVTVENLRGVLPTVSQHVMTREMRRALERLHSTLTDLGFGQAASAVEDAALRLPGHSETAAAPLRNGKVARPCSDEVTS